MPGKEPTEAELDKMIDQSIKDQKQDNQPKQPMEEKNAEKKEQNKEQKKEDKKKDKKKDDKKDTDKSKSKEPKMKVVEGFDPWNVLHYPHLAEKSMNMVEMQNMLVFIVRRDARKDKIKEAVEKGFGVKVLKVNVTITRKGQKKAYIKLGADYDAADIATRLGMI